jgi:hypothetical protein
MFQRLNQAIFSTMVHKLKKGVYRSFCMGFVVGMFPAKCSIQKRADSYKYDTIHLPLIGGVAGATAFVLSPLIIVNYFTDGRIFCMLFGSSFALKIEKHKEQTVSYLIVYIRDQPP